MARLRIKAPAAYVRTVEALPARRMVHSLAVFARRQPIGALAGVMLLLVVFSAILAPLISPYDPTDTRVGPILDAPSSSFLFGTDNVGRDVLSRVLHGGRPSLFIGVLSVLLGTTIGTTVGLVSGYFGGKLDMFLQRVIDGIMSLPALVTALVLISVMGNSSGALVLVISIVFVPGAARIMRGTVLSVKQNMYVDAARAMGANDGRILGRHILPNVMAPLLIIISVSVGNGILVEASLSFLGLGTSVPDPSWGAMLSVEGRREIVTAPWLGIFPGVFLTLAVLGFNLVGDALRDELDPRMRGAR